MQRFLPCRQDKVLAICFFTVTQPINKKSALKCNEDMYLNIYM